MSVIETNGVTKRYGSGEGAVLAVNDLDLTVEEGEVFGFLGPNGAGKSTTIDVLLGFATPTDGSAEVLGHDAVTESEAVRERVGVLPEGYGLYDRLTGRRHLELAAEWTDAAADPVAMLDRVGLDADDADRVVGDYSKGMTQRLALAMALVGDPDLLILDEPSSGLDPNGIRLMREIVREEAEDGTAVFFSSHVLGQVEAVCDRVGILHDGRLVAVDTVDGLREAVGAGSTLKLRLADDPGAAEDGPGEAPGIDAVGDLEGVEGIDAVGREDGLLTVSCSDPRAKARAVSMLADAGIEILDVTSEEASLESVFAAYTTGGEGSILSDRDGDPEGDGRDGSDDGADTGREVVA
ncbi:ABC transporter ATP-binding protein [Halobacteriales archaeon QS_8_69_26]|nr:MAG: ABC transporter ATP-binding protein [Halobacteriales archaeon QS_8_69_26]